MPVLTVGNTDIPYTVRRSSKAKKRRIVVTPGQVEIVAPEGSEDASIADFVHKQRRWIFDKRQEVETRARQLESQQPSRFVTGAKIPYRGRLMRLTVQLADVDDTQVVYRNGFLVTVPGDLSLHERDRGISEALTLWLKGRVAQDIDSFVSQYSKRLGVIPKGVRIKEQKHLWGSCGRDQVINLNWHLIFAPKPVLEYAVVHELCHLIHRNHSAEFWGVIGGQLPDYELRKGWLEDNEHVINKGLSSIISW